MKPTARLRAPTINLFEGRWDDVPNGQGQCGRRGAGPFDSASTNPLRHQFDYGRSDYDRRHIAVISYVWDLPSFTNQNLLMREIAGGWQLTELFAGQSGQALRLRRAPIGRRRVLAPTEPCARRAMFMEARRARRLRLLASII